MLKTRTRCLLSYIPNKQVLVTTGKRLVRFFSVTIVTCLHTSFFLRVRPVLFSRVRARTTPDPATSDRFLNPRTFYACCVSKRWRHVTNGGRATLGAEDRGRVGSRVGAAVAVERRNLGMEEEFAFVG